MVTHGDGHTEANQDRHLRGSGFQVGAGRKSIGTVCVLLASTSCVYMQCGDGTSLGCINPFAEEGIEYACKYSYECKAQGSSACVSEGTAGHRSLFAEVANSS
jgi:hypothetical protein